MRNIGLAVLLGTTALALASAADTRTAAELAALAEKSFAVREADAAAEEMALKKETVSGLPDLRLGYEVMDAQNPDMIAHKFTLSQELPLWRKPSLRRAAAEIEAAAAAIMRTDRANEARRMLAESLIDLHYARRVLAVQEAQVAAFRGFAEAAKGKYAAGAASLSALNRAEIEIAQTEGLMAESGAMAQAAVENALGAVGADEKAVDIGPFTPRAAAGKLDAEELFRKALSYSPTVAAAANDIEKAKRERSAAAAELLPDLMLDFAYTYQPAAEAPNSFTIGVSVNLPAFSAAAKNAETAMAAKRAEEGSARLAGARSALYRGIRAKAAEIESLRKRAALYADRVKGLRASDLENQLSAYAVDKADFDMVLDAARMRFDAEMADAAVRRSLALALTELQYLTGEKLISFDDGRTE